MSEGAQTKAFLINSLCGSRFYLCEGRKDQPPRFMKMWELRYMYMYGQKTEGVLTVWL